MFSLVLLELVVLVSLFPCGYMCPLGAGAFIMRSAGCTVNDLWDKDFDAKVGAWRCPWYPQALFFVIYRGFRAIQVSRTRLRPLAAGALTVPQAFGFLGAQLVASLAVLFSMDINLYTYVFVC